MSLLMLATLVAYFLLLLFVARRTSRPSRGNDAFFRASRRSPWWMVGFGMIGASISGVSFVSVPGWVGTTGMTYLQMCLGFIVGYIAVAFILLPLYYRLRLTSIYAYLGERFGRRSRLTGASFFLVSKLAGAAARLYLACLVLQQFLLPSMAGDVSATSLLSFAALALVVLLLIWAYTRRSGIFTIVRTDAVQTLCMLLALATMIVVVASRLDLSFAGVVDVVRESPLSEVFCFDGASRQNFWRQFLSGAFIVVVMTGLDQDMMQKNLTCRTLREAQKNMCSYGVCFLPVNLLLLSLGVLLYALCARLGIEAPAGDALLPTLARDGVLGAFFIVPFSVGVVAAAFSSADSALAALTTSFCIDILRIEDRTLSAERQTAVRQRVHLAMSAAFLLCVVGFRVVGSQSIIDLVYVVASYTYGPLLGLYAFGLFSHRRVVDLAVPFVCIAAPIVCAALDYLAPRLWNYTFGYELLMLNGVITAAGLLCFSRRGR